MNCNSAIAIAAGLLSVMSPISARFARGCDPVSGCQRRTYNCGRMRTYAVASP